MTLLVSSTYTEPSKLCQSVRVPIIPIYYKLWIVQKEVLEHTKIGENPQRLPDGQERSDIMTRQSCFWSIQVK